MKGMRRKRKNYKEQHVGGKDHIRRNTCKIERIEKKDKTERN
jgi:hypothetical protein